MSAWFLLPLLAVVVATWIVLPITFAARAQRRDRRAARIQQLEEWHDSFDRARDHGVEAGEAIQALSTTYHDAIRAHLAARGRLFANRPRDVDPRPQVGSRHFPPAVRGPGFADPRRTSAYLPPIPDPWDEHDNPRGEWFASYDA